MKHAVRFLLAFLVAMAGLGPVSARAELSATALRIAGDGNETRVEVEFNGDPQVQPRLLSQPHRLILDMPQTLFAIDTVQPKSGSMIASFRSGMMQEGRSRMIFTLTGPFSLHDVTTEAAPDGRHQIFRMTVRPSTEEAFSAVLSDQVLSTASTAGGKGDRVVQGEDSGLFKVVIDAGHGGIDGGATGIHGASEKAVTLDFAKELAASLAGAEGVKVFLTREDDRFIALDERVRIARQLDGDLFLSIHADSISDKRLRGATVYTLSDRASDEVAQAVANNENLSDAIGGVEPGMKDEVVADILIDLTRRETMQYSVGIARTLVDALKDKAKLINNSHRSAGFRVLKAPDIPSVLVELGYLSNEEDEKQITDPLWRKMIADELAKAIKVHAEQAIAVRQ